MLWFKFVFASIYIFLELSYTMGAFFWDYSGYSYSGLGITEYTEFQFPKERSFMLKMETTHGGGDLRTTTSSSQRPGDWRGRPRWISCQKFPKRTYILPVPSKPYSVHSVHSAIGSRMNTMIFHSSRKWNSSQKNTNTVYSGYSYSGIVPKECPLYCISCSSNLFLVQFIFSFVSYLLSLIIII